MARARSTFLAAISAATLLAGNEAGADDLRFGAEAARNAEEHRQAIAAERAAEAGEGWAGSYYGGDGLGVNQTLELAPRAGFVFEWRGCLGLYDRNYGPVVVDGQRLRLVPEFENSEEGFQGIASELYWVPWGERSYLVPVDSVQEFCNDVNAGLEPRDGAHGRALLRAGDWEQEAVGRPKLPPGWARCLLAAPIEAKVISVDGSTSRLDSIETRWLATDVTIDRGERDGIALGMLLGVIAGGGYDLGEVVAVDGTTARVRFEELEELAEVSRIVPGMILSTRPFESEKRAPGD